MRKLSLALPFAFGLLGQPIVVVAKCAPPVPHIHTIHQDGHWSSINLWEVNGRVSLLTGDSLNIQVEWTGGAMCNGGYEIYLDGERLLNITLPYRFAAVGYYDMYFYSTYGGFETQAHFEVELEVPVAEMEIATSNRIDEPFLIGSLTDDILVIEIPDRDYDVEIFTLDGTICRRLHLPSQQSRATLDLQWTKPGLYFVRFTHGLKSNVARFVRY